ncbi:MAG: hypothetical protein GTO41_11440, partial [Burkholderiales bacterium]|nr:hypothetical protein [Burkholderiales bacterium]
MLEQQERRQQPQPAVIPKQAPLKTAKRAPKLDKPRVSEKRQPRAVPETIEGARRKAERAGLLAFKDELTALRDDATLKQIKRRTPLTRGAATRVASAERAVVTAEAARGSGGISTAKLSRDTGGGALAGRRTVSIDSPVADVRGGGRVQRGGGRKASRSIEEVQLVFDKNKAAIYSIYNRALR